jgi:uncharacterized lipoprotein YddW (UPF0748 family)
MFSNSVSAVQKHGLWVVRFALKNDNVNEIISVSSSLGITDLYVQVWALSEDYYRNKDHFKNLVKKAHDNNIRVHAWINVLYVWSGNDKPGIDRTSYKSLLRAKKSLPKYKELKSKGIEGYYIHPYDEINIKILSGMIDELIDDYDVDGIHLDYFRYPDLKYSLSPTGRARFMLKYYYDPYILFSNNGRLTANSEFIYQQYSEFLKDELTDVLKLIKSKTARPGKEIELSIAVKPDADIAENNYFQSWKSWLEKNICDYVIIMNYNADNIIFRANLNKAAKLNENNRVVIGIATYNQNWQSFMQKYDMVLKSNVNGTAIFSYNYLNEHKYYYNKIKKQIATGKRYGNN